MAITLDGVSLNADSTPSVYGLSVSYNKHDTVLVASESVSSLTGATFTYRLQGYILWLLPTLHLFSILLSLVPTA